MFTHTRPALFGGYFAPAVWGRRAAFALGVFGLLIYELAVGQNQLAVLIQAALILSITVTSALESSRPSSPA